jgi:hypothetical protein
MIGIADPGQAETDLATVATSNRRARARLPAA